MKHRLSITILLLAMFLATQFLGLFVANQLNQNLPYGLEETNQDINQSPIFIVLNFVFAFAIIFTLIKYKLKTIIKIWFFLVIILALSISIYAILTSALGFRPEIEMVAFLIAIPLATLKVFRPNSIIHNSTELLIYPGIATVFISILSPKSIMILLIFISFYDMWAVWKSGIMQKMAKFQMEEVKIFGGFLLPTFDKKTKKKLSEIKEKYKNKKIPKSIKEKKFKVNLAILGGGDVVFPIITAGVFLKYHGIIPALMIIAGAFLGLLFLFINTKKDKAYPAMPYISAGIFLSILIQNLFL